MLDGRVMFARYLGFSCRVLMMSVRFLLNRALREPEKSLKRVLVEPYYRALIQLYYSLDRALLEPFLSSALVLLPCVDYFRQIPAVI